MVAIVLVKARRVVDNAGRGLWESTHEHIAYCQAAIATTAMMISLTPALADRIDQRQYNQAQRIEQGYRYGQLTPQEARRLKMEQRRIAATERRFERDGHLTRGERAYLNYEQNRASRHIYSERHDGQWRGRRYGYGYGFYGYRPYRPYYAPRPWW